MLSRTKPNNGENTETINVTASILSCLARQISAGQPLKHSHSHNPTPSYHLPITSLVYHLQAVHGTRKRAECGKHFFEIN